MTFKQIFIGGIIVGSLAALLSLLGVLSPTASKAPTAGSIDVPIYAIATSSPVSVTTASTLVIATSSPVSVTTASTLVIATSTSRRFLYLQNTSATVPAYCAFNDVAAVSGLGFFIAASSTFLLPFGDGTMYSGAIRCIASQTIILLVSQA